MCRLIEHRYLDNIFKKVSRLCCPDYIIFTQAKIRWQFKSTKNSIKSYIRKSQHNAPGACISTDQIVFPIPGIILQVKGKIMKAFFYGAIVFVHHKSDYTYVHLMLDNFCAFLLGIKVSFERLYTAFQIRIIRYHGDNERYNNKDCRQNILNNNHSIIFCGVKSHHSTEITERQIRLSSELTRVSILYAKLKWHGVITEVLWPFALKVSCRIINLLFLDEHSKYPREKESRIDR